MPSTATGHDPRTPLMNAFVPERAADHDLTKVSQSKKGREGVVEEGDEDTGLLEGNWSEEEEEEDVNEGINYAPRGEVTVKGWLRRHARNILHFIVEDWCLSAMLGIFTAIISIAADVAIEYILHVRIYLFDTFFARSRYEGFGVWMAHSIVCVTGASLFCRVVSSQAVGSGIPEVKVIISGYVLKNYLSLRTLLAKVVGLTLTIGGGMPVGKEGPFVHMGAIVASLLTRASASCRFNEFFSNEGREMEMLSMGCAVGIACTFSAPAGGVLYGIESTSKYFAVKSYWKSFFATTFSALVFRFAMNGMVPPSVAGTIAAYYQTNLPNEVFLVEEVPLFILLGLICGLAAALFIHINRQIVLAQRKSSWYQWAYGKSPVLVTVLFACCMAFMTNPAGIGPYLGGKLSFRESLADFISNCTFVHSNVSSLGCSPSMLLKWKGVDGSLDPLATISLYIIFYYLVVALCITMYIPSGIFVPAFAVGAGAGRLMGELLSIMYPEGLRGPDNIQIYPGLYAVVGAAAYTGAMTHSLSIAVIVFETTGQLCGLLPVLIALMVANAVCAFLQPSIYESTILLKNLPYLTDLPPSRISVHTMKVEEIMVKDIVVITRESTYRELREVVLETPQLRSYPFVTDKDSMSLLGSVSRRFLVHLLQRKLGPDSALMANSRKGSTIDTHAVRRHSQYPLVQTTQPPLYLTDNIHHSPHLSSSGLKAKASTAEFMSVEERAAILACRLSSEDMNVDPAPFQLVKGTTLFKVHTLFSLLGLNHAYVTDRGRLIGVVSLKELRDTLADIYMKGAQAPGQRKKTKKGKKKKEAPKIPPPSSVNPLAPLRQ